MPKVSVCVPTYNYAHYIECALSSVLSQDYDDFEVIVTDDLSTDNTQAIVEEICRRDQRVTYHRNESKLGLFGNFNRALLLASGEYVAFLCADDVWYPGYLSQTVRRLDNSPRVGFVHTAWYRLDAAGREVGLQRGPWKEDSSGQDYFLTFFLSRTTALLSSWLVRKTLLDVVEGFDLDFPFAADSAMTLRLALFNDVAYVPEPLVGYREHGKSATYVGLRQKRVLQESIRLMQTAFRWPEVAELGLLSHRASAERAMGAEIVSNLPFFRTTGVSRSEVVGLLVTGLTLSPALVLSPRAWVRFAFSLMPAPAVSALRQRVGHGWGVRVENIRENG